MTMGPNRFGFAALLSLTVASLLAPPALAQETGNQTAVQASAIKSNTPDGEQQKPPPVAVAKPIGKVVVAGTGDRLGVIRYARRVESGGLRTVAFSRSNGAARVANFDRSKLPALLPINGRLSSNFGARRHPISGMYRQHSGIDLAAPIGTPIRATKEGVVVTSGWSGGYGIMVRLDHGNGVETRYAHMSRAVVRSGQSVKAGQIIGAVGSTGRSTGPHLHYELRLNNVAVNPLQ